MPKRARETGEELKYFAKKLKKLEKEVRRSRANERNSRLSSSSSSSQSSSTSTSRSSSPEIREEQDPTNDISPPPQTSSEDQTVTKNVPEVLPADPTQEGQEILAVLGADPTITVEYGQEIQADVANRFEFITTNGLGKDIQKEPVTKYLVPSNCIKIGAPDINPEIKAAVTEQVLKRDKAKEAKQKLIAAGISCLGKIISDQLSASQRNNDLLKDLMNVGRVLCDIQHTESTARRNFALFSVKRELKDHVSKTKIDKFLFGIDLVETLKTAKAVTRSTSDLKPENKKSKASSSATSNAKNLNWRAGSSARRRPPAPPPRRHPPAMPLAPPLPPPTRGTLSHTYTRRHKQTRHR